MRHPSKVNPFCTRKGDRHPTSGAPQCGKHLKRGPRARRQPAYVPFYMRLRLRARRDAIRRAKREAVKRQKVATA